MLAALLGPREFGLFGVAFVSTVIIDRLTRTGFDQALIQRREASSAHLDVAWTIQVVPTVVKSGEDGLTVSYSASIQPFLSGSANDGETDQPMTAATAGAPWNHHLESSSAKDATKAVADAEPDQRYQKLLELVHALQTGDEGG